MECKVYLGHEAEKKLLALPSVIATGFRHKVEQLAADPTQGRPCCFPHPQLGYMHSFDVEYDGDIAYFTVFFLPDSPLYGGNVKELSVTDFSVHPLSLISK